MLKNLGIVLFLCMCLAGFCLSDVNASTGTFNLKGNVANENLWSIDVYDAGRPNHVYRIDRELDGSFKVPNTRINRNDTTTPSCLWDTIFVTVTGRNLGWIRPNVMVLIIGMWDGSDITIERNGDRKSTYWVGYLRWTYQNTTTKSYEISNRID
jgi:hypothetical protein